MKNTIYRVTLLQIFLTKEKVYWNRMLEMRKKKKLNIFMWIIITFIISILHYCFAFMHTMLDMYLLIFNKTKFKNNLLKEAVKLKLIPPLNTV